MNACLNNFFENYFDVLQHVSLWISENLLSKNVSTEEEETG
jgi:hypothetical protein